MEQARKEDRKESRIQERMNETSKYRKKASKNENERARLTQRNVSRKKEGQSHHLMRDRRRHVLQM